MSAVLAYFFATGNTPENALAPMISIDEISVSGEVVASVISDEVMTRWDRDGEYVFSFNRDASKYYKVFIDGGGGATQRYQWGIVEPSIWDESVQQHGKNETFGAYAQRTILPWISRGNGGLSEADRDRLKNIENLLHSLQEESDADEDRVRFDSEILTILQEILKKSEESEQRINAGQINEMIDAISEHVVDGLIEESEIDSIISSHS